MILGAFGTTRPGGYRDLVGGGIGTRTYRAPGWVLDVEGYRTATPEERAISDKNTQDSLDFQAKLWKDAQDAIDADRARRQQAQWERRYASEIKEATLAIQGGSGKSYAIPIIVGGAILAFAAWKFL